MERNINAFEYAIAKRERLAISQNTQPGHHGEHLHFRSLIPFRNCILKAIVIMAIKLQDINYNKMMALAMRTRARTQHTVRRELEVHCKFI